MHDVAAYKLTGPRGSEAVAILLPCIEMFLAGCLVLSVGLPVTGLLAAALFLGFAVVAITVIRRGIVTDCGCFGRFMRRRVGVPLLVGDLVIAAVLIADAIAVPPQLVWVQNQTEVLIVLGVFTVINIGLQLSYRAQQKRDASSET